MYNNKNIKTAIEFIKIHKNSSLDNWANGKVFKSKRALLTKIYENLINDVYGFVDNDAVIDTDYNVIERANNYWIEIKSWETYSNQTEVFYFK